MRPDKAPVKVAVVMLAVPNVVVPVTPNVPLIVALPPMEAMFPTSKLFE